MSKRRLSTTVDVDLCRQLEHDERLRAVREFISAYEAEHGEISKAEVAIASERARARAIVVRRGTASIGG